MARSSHHNDDNEKCKACIRVHVCLQTNGAVRSIVRKKAATCLLRLIRKSPPEAEILQPDVWSVKLVGPLICCGCCFLVGSDVWTSVGVGKHD